MAFHGYIIAMGINKLPSLGDYFKDDKYFRNNFISEIFSKNEFKNIYRNIHLVDNERVTPKESPEYDKLYKTRPIISHLKRVFKENVKVGTQITIDESIIKCKGNLN